MPSPPPALVACWAPDLEAKRAGRVGLKNATNIPLFISPASHGSSLFLLAAELDPVLCPTTAGRSRERHLSTSRGGRSWHSGSGHLRREEFSSWVGKSADPT